MCVLGSGGGGGGLSKDWCGGVVVCFTVCKIILGVGDMCTYTWVEF